MHLERGGGKEKVGKGQRSELSIGSRLKKKLERSFVGETPGWREGDRE